MDFISTYHTNAALDAIVTTAGTITIALSTTEPIADDTNPAGVSNVTEPSGGDYARVSLPTSGWGAASDRIKATIADVAFPNPTADWGTISHIVAYSGSRCVFVGPLDDEIEVLASGNSVTIPAGTISLSLPL